MPDSSPMVTPAQRKWLPWLTAVGFFMQTLDGTILNTALPSMAEALGESPLQMQSVIIAYMLTVALLIPASGWLADRFGTRRVYLVAILLFTLGSLACAIANTLPMLVIARVLQGSGALLMPIGRLAVLRVYSKHELLRVMSFVTIPGLLGPSSARPWGLAGGGGELALGLPHQPAGGPARLRGELALHARPSPAHRQV